MKSLLCILLAVFSSSVLAAHELPNVEMVKKFMQRPDHLTAKVASCKDNHMISGSDHDCWAAHTAKDLLATPKDTQELILSKSKLESAESRCQAMSIKGRFESRECAAAGQADTFISLRLPSIRGKLEPVKFK